MPWSLSAGEGDPHHCAQGVALFACEAGAGGQLSGGEGIALPTEKLSLQECLEQRSHVPDILWGCWSLSKRNGPKERQLGSPCAQNMTNGPSAFFTEGKPEASLAVPYLR